MLETLLSCTPRTASTIDKVANAFRELRKFMPTGPLMNSDRCQQGGSWTRSRIWSITASILTCICANYGPTYQPDITSYDYDAPLTEAGDPTPKYFAIRDALTKLKTFQNLAPLRKENMAK
ncbi:unnamed protein product [Leptidea sinapis]|uniref:Glycoside hydrolase 35 catalytic domain-containing protein n=1 Tax=Leptidea sinapis TaxID=189913 RepID=A0A5E4QFY5_9NEOP|nr:unnamed protein product [Leptidea sinapis]